MPILSGCVSNFSVLKGQTQAGVSLPAWPEECRKKELHAALKKGEDARIILKRERSQLARQNLRTDTCSAYYDELAKRMAGKK